MPDKNKAHTFSIVLARLVRETVFVQVEAESLAEAKQKACQLYENDEGLEWEIDVDWGVEDGTNTVVLQDDVPMMHHFTCGGANDSED